MSAEKAVLLHPVADYSEVERLTALKLNWLYSEEEERRSPPGVAETREGEISEVTEGEALTAVPPESRSRDLKSLK